MHEKCIAIGRVPSLALGCRVEDHALSKGITETTFAVESVRKTFTMKTMPIRLGSGSSYFFL